MPLLRKLFKISRFPDALRTQFEAEGLVYLAEKVSVRQRFSGSVPGLFSASGGSRGQGTLALTGQRIYATYRSAARLKGPVIDARWNASDGGAAKASVSQDGVQLDLEVHQVDPRFHGQLSVRFKAVLSDAVLAALPATSLSFDVTPEYVFHILGVRVKPAK
jgi:hypothetical protein